MVKNQKGVSLVELIAAIPLTILVFVILTMAVSSFVTTYKETRLYLQLQDELYNMVDLIRHGYIDKNIEASEGLIGLMTANRVEISGGRNMMTLRPVIIAEGLPDAYKTTFYADSDGRLLVSGQYGLNSFQETQIFPSSNRKIGRELQFRLIDQDVFTVTQNSTYGPIMVKLHFKGQVRFREKEIGQNPLEDKKLNTRIVEYNTSVFVGNTKG
jgi:hypothetical protein